MKIIMLGAPGAGKGTQAIKISEKYGIPHISTGDIFRANIKAGTELGRKAKEYMDQGLLVPDALTTDLVVNRTSEPDCENGYVLDGFPRTIPQAECLTEALEKRGEKVDFALNVDVPDENIIEEEYSRQNSQHLGKGVAMAHSDLVELNEHDAHDENHHAREKELVEQQAGQHHEDEGHT